MQINIAALNAANGYNDYPEFFDRKDNVIKTPDAPTKYRKGQVVRFTKGDDKGKFAVVLGVIAASCGELRTDLAGMVSFSEIRMAKKSETAEMPNYITKHL